MTIARGPAASLWALLFLLAGPARAGITARIPAGQGDPGFPNWFFVSPDGYHFALIQVDKGVELLIKDGKVAAKGKQTFSSYDDSLHQLRASGAFGSNGRLAMVRALLDDDGRRVGEQVWVDGRPGKVYEQVQGLVMTPDGRRLAYAAKDRAGWHLVVEGAAGPALRSAPTSITFNPQGSEAAYLAEGSLFIGSKRIRPWDAARLLFSPDWKRVAWVKVDDIGRETVGIDDAALGRSSQIHAAGFSPDGARFGYSVLERVGSELKGLVMIDGAQSGPPLESYVREIAYSPARSAYWFGELGPKNHVLFRDGAPGDRWEFVTGRPCVAFSPSGAHSAYAAHRGGQQLLVVDGVPEPGGPNVLFGNSGLVFDDEREFHFFSSRGFDTPELVCAAVGRAPAPEESACVRKARRVFPADAAQP